MICVPRDSLKTVPVRRPAEGIDAIEELVDFDALALGQAAALLADVAEADHQDAPAGGVGSAVIMAYIELGLG